MAGDDMYNDSSCTICSDSDGCAGIALTADAHSFAKVALTIGFECEDDVDMVEVDGVGCCDGAGAGAAADSAALTTARFVTSSAWCKWVGDLALPVMQIVLRPFWVLAQLGMLN